VPRSHRDLAPAAATMGLGEQSLGRLVPTMGAGEVQRISSVEFETRHSLPVEDGADG